MEIPNVQESHLLECASNFAPWKCKLQNLLEAKNLLYLVEEVKPSYRSQISRRVQHECSEHEACPAKFSERSFNPSYHQEEHYQGDV
jgi:hypothetical protein